MSVRRLSGIEREILRLLPPDIGSGRRWLTAADVGERIGLDPERVRHYLVRMRSSHLVESDRERPQGFARAPQGDRAMEFIV